jgi:hypothetical protein
MVIIIIILGNNDKSRRIWSSSRRDRLNFFLSLKQAGPDPAPIKDKMHKSDCDQ